MDANFQPDPGVVLGGASGSFIGFLPQSADLDNGRGMARVREGLFAVSGIGGVVQFLSWNGDEQRFEIVRLGALTGISGVALDDDQGLRTLTHHHRFHRHRTRRQKKLDHVSRIVEDKLETKIEGNGYAITARVPLADFGFKPNPGQRHRADFGATFGNAGGTDTNLRSYWSNQSTGLVDDIPGEIMLSPNLWGGGPDRKMKAPAVTPFVHGKITPTRRIPTSEPQRMARGTTVAESRTFGRAPFSGRAVT
ncbi:MAG: hypothetical protein ACJA16_001663 [Akkermansiaceae bacterium]|jgi:hypothetical protein